MIIIIRNTICSLEPIACLDWDFIKMKQAMWKVDPTGTFSFSDLSNPDQPFLFSPVPEYYRLKALLQTQFSGKSVTVRQVEEYIIADTPFCSNRSQVTVLKPMEHEGQIKIVNPLPGRKRALMPTQTFKFNSSDGCHCIRRLPTREPSQYVAPSAAISSYTQL